MSPFVNRFAKFAVRRIPEPPRNTSTVPHALPNNRLKTTGLRGLHFPTARDLFIQTGTKVVTNMAVLEIKENQFHLLERAPGVTIEEIQKATEGTLIVKGEIPEMNI